jgi:putative FmdB family regulatory protein
MRYDYECPKCGVMEITHSMAEDRKGRTCPCANCEEELRPLISGGAGIILTGRPPWAYNDTIKAAKNSEQQGGNLVNRNTTVTDKRDDSKYKGKKVKVNRNMGNYNAQW